MEVKNLHDLEKIIALCRKKGVENIEISGIKLVLTAEEPKSRYLLKKQKPLETTSEFNRPYTDEETMFYSSTSIAGLERE